MRMILGTWLMTRVMRRRGGLEGVVRLMTMMKKTKTALREAR